jgi:hypothetical protein
VLKNPENISNQDLDGLVAILETDNESFTEIFKKKVKIYSNDTITFLES